MSDPGLVRVTVVPESLSAIAHFQPAWTRLEPQSLTGDPTPGLEARVHDPLWLLGRQWQFCEFKADDAGSPIGVRVAAITRPITAWRPGSDPAAAWLGLPADRPLDPLVERETPTTRGPGLRQRAEAGALLVDMLADAGFDARAKLLAECPLPLGAAPPPQVPAELWNPPRAFATIARSSPDGEQAASVLEAGAPPWLAGAGADAVAAAADWLGWYRGSVSPHAADAPSSWIPDRLEYRFAMRAASSNDAIVLEAPLHLGGSIEWHDFDQAQQERIAAPDDQQGNVAPAARTKTMLPTPLTYAGMPSSRLWQFENGSVNFGMLNVQPHDPARLCLVEFATIFGDDWFLVPFDVDTSALTTLTAVSYTNTFGERIAVPAADDRTRTGRFRLFEISVAGSDTDTLRGLLLPPTVRGALQSRAVEEVQFLRDEAANLCWALERQVQPASGDPRNRGDEPKPAPPSGAPLEGADLRYLLATPVPDYWIPLVPMPIAGGNGGFFLRKGSIGDADAALGILLEPRPFDLKDEEVPREGVRVRRVAELARAIDGTTLRWIARRVGVGRGQGSSALAYDSAVRNKPAGLI
jgi:hypothetical protein